MNEMELAKHLINDLGIEKEKVAIMLKALRGMKNEYERKKKDC